MQKLTTCQMCEDHPATWSAHLAYPVTQYAGDGYYPATIEEDLVVCERCKRQMDEQGDLVTAHELRPNDGCLTQAARHMWA